MAFDREARPARPPAASAARSASSARISASISTTRMPPSCAALSSERSKILPRRTTGTCAMHQRQLTEAIKRARQIALLPFVTE